MARDNGKRVLQCLISMFYLQLLGAGETDASELLLELMVRIAAHPQQWNQVHQLLRKYITSMNNRFLFMNSF